MSQPFSLGATSRPHVSDHGPATAARFGMTETRLEALARDIEQIRNEVLEELGSKDVDYIRGVIRWQRALMLAGRGSLFFGFFPPAWVFGTLSIGVSKILDNMEIGHNVLHGQYDWSRDPALHSTTFEWDNACPAAQWKHTHNYQHHTYTNINGKDRDVGYGLLRVSERQPWRPAYLGNVLYAVALALGFEYGLMLHDVAINDVFAGRKPWRVAGRTLKEGLRKTASQSLKDLVLWPALTGPLFLSTLTANATANVMRNVWAFSVIFCGHFPEGVFEFTEAECEDESRGHWYFRQLLGSANLTGGPLFHIMTGNLSHQIEHHLFPDLPAHRYAELSPRVQAICERYGLPYNQGPMHRQLATVLRKIVKLSLPPRRTRPGVAGSRKRPLSLWFHADSASLA